MEIAIIALHDFRYIIYYFHLLNSSIYFYFFIEYIFLPAFDGKVLGQTNETYY